MKNWWSESVVTAVTRYIWYGLLLGVALAACEAQPTLLEPKQIPTTVVVEAGADSRPAHPLNNKAPLSPIAGQALKFERLSLEQGLSSNLVQAVLQDRQGFMWFGTLEGLNKYDGYEVTIYRPEPGNPNSLSDTVINGIYEDRAGNLWMATTNGLNKFDPETETFTRYQHQSDNPRSLSDNALSVANGFYEDRAGNLWFSTWAGGLNKLDPATETFTRYQHRPDDPDSLISNAIIKLFPAVEGEKLWLGTPLGLELFDPAAETFTHYQPDPTSQNSLSHGEVHAIYATFLAGKPVVWVGTGDGLLNQLNPETEIFTHHPVGHTKITAIYEADDGMLWLGTQGEGLSIFDPATGKVVGQYRQEPGRPNSLSADLVNQIYQDRTGTLWIATYTGGVSRLDPQRKAFRLYRRRPDDPNSLSSSQVYALDVGRDGTLWIGTLDAGLNKFNPRTGTFTRYLHDPEDPNSLSHNLVTDVLEDSQGRVWIATVGGGLNKFDPATETFTHYRYDETDPHSPPSDGVLTIFEDSAGMVWLGTADAGLSQLDPATETFSHYRPDPTAAGTLSDGSIGSIFEDSQGRLWVGTKRGLDRFHPATERFTNYHHDDSNLHSLSHNYVKAIYEDGAGRLWLATDVGLNQFDPETGRFKAYFEKDGLAHDQVASIISDDQGYLWVGTSGGLSRFDPAAETFRNYNRHDGLQGDLFYPYAVAKGSDGELHFGGSKGLNIFQPDQLRDNPYPPPVVLTEFQLFNEPVPPGSKFLPKQVNLVGEITLPYNQSVVGFEFAALNYTAPAKNQYAYTLEGFDQSWTYIDSNRRFARYTNLDPGTYLFRVKASNNDGVWNETGASVSIVITPPWWETIWFRALALALAAGLVWAGFQWRVWAIQRQRRRLEIQVDERTKELQTSEAALRRAKQAAEAANQAKSLFLANMSHELRTPLNTILGYAQILCEPAAPDDELESGLNIIQRSGDHLLALIDDILDIAKVEAEQVELHPTNFNLPDFLGEIAEIMRLRAGYKGLSFRFETVHFTPSAPPAGATSHPAADRRGSLPATVHGDARRLRQILLNLLSNAVKFTEKGEVKFRVGPVVSQGALLRFQVEDTGPGIAAEDLDRIFEPFQQIRTGARPVEGSGLGLAISRRLVQMMGGELRASSIPGQGSIFWFHLPLPEVTGAPDASVEHRQIISLKGQPPKILVVDDIEDNRAVLAKQLSRLGFEVAQAGGGAEGLVEAGQFKPEVVIVDLMMPNIAGLELVRRLRQALAFKETVVVVTSASVFEEDRQKSLAAGADDFLPKPVKTERLLEILEQHLNLEWRYTGEKEPGMESGALPSSSPLPAGSIPPPEEVAQLYRLAMMGHAAALQQRAVELARSDERLAPFAGELERLAKKLKMNEISQFLEQYLER